MIDVLGPEKRRRRTGQEKIAIVQQSFEPGMTASPLLPGNTVWQPKPVISGASVMSEGSLTAVAAVSVAVVSASGTVAAMKQIFTKNSSVPLGKKTMENELLKEAVEYGRKSG